MKFVAVKKTMHKTLILGSPGTGKTTYLIKLLEDYLKTISIDRIAYVSFTKNAIYKVIKLCLEKFTQYKEKDFLYFKTLHALCFYCLNLNIGRVLDDKRKKEFTEIMHLNGNEVNMYYTEENITEKRCLPLYALHLATNTCRTIEEVLQNIDTEVDYSDLMFILQAYEKYKNTYGLLDFNDMLDVSKIEPLNIDIVFCDEAQDLTPLQWKVFDKLFSKAKKVYVCGDDDQSIFEWSGVDPRYLSKIHFNKKIVLDKTYRLPSNILANSQRIISSVRNRFEKKVLPVKTEGVMQSIEDIEYLNSLLVDSIQNKESWLFLSRTVYRTNYFKDFLFENGFPFAHFQKNYFNFSVLEAIKLYHKVRVKNVTPDNTQRKVLKKYFKTVDQNYWYRNIKLNSEEILYYRKVLSQKLHIPHNIKVSTIHRVKGEEFDNVVILPDTSRRIYQASENNPDSETRVKYVAYTRASKAIYTLTPRSVYY